MEQSLKLDKKDLLLPESQRELMAALADCGKPVILCLMAGSDLDLSYAREHFDAILVLWYPGAEGGKAAAKVLFGETAPTGKLPVTFYESLEELPDFEDYTMEGRTYRYLKGKAQYPFGYGLTYGKLEITNAEIQEKGNGAEVVVTVHNREEREVTETLQIYVRSVESPCAPLHPSLSAFARITVRPGKTMEKTLVLDERAFTVVDEKGQRQAVSGAFEVYAGFSQPDERSVELMGCGPVRMEIRYDSCSQIS